MKTKLFLPILVLLLSISLGYASDYTVCKEGCNFTDITKALENVSSSNNTLTINGSGNYAINGTYNYNLPTKDTSMLLNSSAVVLDCNNSLFTGNSSGIAIKAIKNNVTIRRCGVSNFTRAVKLLGSKNSALNNNSLSNSDYGLHLQISNNTLIKNTLLDHINITAILFNSASENTLVNSNISNPVSGAYSIDSTGESKNYLLNSSYKGTLSFDNTSHLNISQYFRVHVNDTEGNNIDSAFVEVRANNTLRHNLTTNNTGFTPWENITTQTANSEGILDYNNFSLYTTNSTNFDYGYVNITSSEMLTVTFNTTKPVISDIENKTTNSTCNISFKTDIPASSGIIYGENNLSNLISNITYNKNHTYHLTGLSDETIYNYSIIACNENGYCSNSSLYNFTTNKTIDHTPPNISDISTTTTNESASIGFTTDDQSNVTLSYGTTENMYNEVKNSSYVESHAINIQELLSDTLYYFRINACNNDSYCSNTSTLNFTTEKSPDTTPPAIDFEKPRDDNSSVYNEWLNRKISLTASENSQCSIISIHDAIKSTQLQTNDNLSYSSKFNSTEDSDDFYVEVECIDDAGNSASKEVSFSVNDTTKPGLSFTSETIEDEGYTNKSKLDIYVSVGEPPLANPSLSVDGTNNTMNGEATDYIYNHTTDELSEGEHNITAYAKDQSGNLASVKRTIYTDYTTPELTTEEPSNNTILDNCNTLEFNLSMSEEGNCAYDLFYVDEEKLTECREECNSDYDDCMEDADNSDEKEECSEQREDCKDTCEEEKYSEEEEGEIQIQATREECKEDCDKNFDGCIDECKEEREECENKDSSDDCYGEYEDCWDTCQEDKQECIEDCEEKDLTYFTDINTHLKNAEYKAELYCEDKAGNGVEDNVTFTVDDTTPPDILSAKPNGTIEDNSPYLKISTNEKSECGYSKDSLNFSNMSMISQESTSQEIMLNDLSAGNYTYYVLCRDIHNNTMESAEEVSFRVNKTKKTDTTSTQSTSSNDDSTSDNKAKYTFPSLKSSEKSSFKINDDDLFVREVSIQTKEDEEDVEVQVEQLNQQDLIDEKPNGTLYKYFTLSSGISNDKIDSVNVNFRVSKDWLNSNNIKPENLYVHHFTNKWEKSKPLVSSEDENYHYYQAESSGLSMFAVTAKEPGQQDSQTTPKPPKQNETSSNKSEPKEEKPDDVNNNFNLYLWIILLCVVVGGGSAAFFVFRSQTKHPQQDQQTAEPKQHAQAAADSSAAASQSQEAKSRSESDTTKDNAENSPSNTREESSSGQAQNEQEKESNAQSATQDPLSQYIQQAREAGQSVTQIQQTLVDAGHNPSNVEEKCIQLGLMQDEVQQYINQAVQAGQNEEEIISALVHNGFDREYVQQKLSQAKKQYAESKTRTSSANATSSAELEDYVKKAFNNGMKEEAIKNSLLDAGYEQQTIDSVLQKFTQQDPNKELREYTQQCFQNGLGKMHIKKILKNAGYNKDEIKQVFKELGK